MKMFLAQTMHLSVGVGIRRGAQGNAAGPPDRVPGIHSLEPSAAATAGSLLGKTGNDSTSPLSVQARQRGMSPGNPPPPPSSHQDPPLPPRSFPARPAFTAAAGRQAGD